MNCDFRREIYLSKVVRSKDPSIKELDDKVQILHFLLGYSMECKLFIPGFSCRYNVLLIFT